MSSYSSPSQGCHQKAISHMVQGLHNRSRSKEHIFRLRRVTVYGGMILWDIGEECLGIVQYLGKFRGGTTVELKGQGDLGRKKWGGKIAIGVSCINKQMDCLIIWP